MIVVFVGPSCSGKSSALKLLEENFSSYQRIKKYSNRKERNVDDIFPLESYCESENSVFTIDYKLFGNAYKYEINSSHFESDVCYLIATQSLDVITTLKEQNQDQMFVVLVKWPKNYLVVLWLLLRRFGFRKMITRFKHGQKLNELSSSYVNFEICPRREGLDESIINFNNFFNEKF